MKINGKEVSNNGHVVGPFPITRTVEGKTVIFGIYAQPVWSYKKFDELYPLPDAPIGGYSVKTGKKERDYKSPQYKQDLEAYSLAREGWTIMHSIGEPSGLEIEGVDMDDPKTWAGICDKLKGGVDGDDGMFSHFEYNKVIALVDEACGIDDEKLAENRESFLSEQQAKNSEATKP